MAFMQIMKNMGVTMAIQAMLMRSEVSSFPSMSPLARLTECVRGRAMFANVWRGAGIVRVRRMFRLARASAFIAFLLDSGFFLSVCGLERILFFPVFHAGCGQS
jgi:hypothetical protein